MSPYLQFGIAMCFVVFIALFATAYLAVMFNRRAKADLAAALSPLATVVDGRVDLEEATVSGTYRGHLAFGRMANASDGPGRVFQTDLVDAAGGTNWEWTTTPNRSPEQPPKERFEPAGDDREAFISPALQDGIAAIIDLRRDRGRVEYDAGTGQLRFVRPMQTRRDIPDATSFCRQLDMLVGIGPVNRRVQGAPDADWVGGRLGIADAPDGDVS